MSEKRNEFTTAALDGAEALSPTILAYARNLLVGTRIRDRHTAEGVLVALDEPWFRRALWEWAAENPEESERPRGALFALLAATGSKPTRVGAAPGLIGANFEKLGRLLGLDRTERAVLQFVLAIRLVRDFEPVAAHYGPLTTPAVAELLSAATGEPTDSVRRALGAHGRLVGTGLLKVDPDPEPLFTKLLPHVRLPDFVTAPRLDARVVADAFACAAPPPTLGSGDFAHVHAALDRLRRLVASALDLRTPGVHVLVHGPSGSGKSELARLLGRELGAAAREPRTDGVDLAAARPWSRLAALLAADRVTSGRNVFLLDDAEELFEPGGPWSGARGEPRAPRSWLYRALERNRSPVIWTVRDAATIDAATLRRFALVLELPALDEPGRLSLWRRAAEGSGAEEKTIRRLARRLPASPAAIGAAARASRSITGGRFDPAIAEAVLEANLKASTGVAPLPLDAVGSDYVVEALNASSDLVAIADQLGASFGAETRGVTLCLHGPSGTGKSQWVRHLAERLGRQLHVQRVADIQSKWVGESEKAVARAFDAAEREGAVLLFDEADSFLRDRGETTHRWEVTLTNEFLQRLESARAIVACTTNCRDDLDPAVLRRFDLKIAFDYLRPAQATRLFASVFGPLLASAPLPEPGALTRALEELGLLAPGDFATVARRARFLGARATTDWLLAELHAEVVARGPHRARIAGFRVG